MTSPTTVPDRQRSGFYGDRFSRGARDARGRRLDVLTGDYLAELTMLILGRDRLKDPTSGYAKTFLRQMEDCLGLALDAASRSSPTPAGSTRPASPTPCGSWPTRLGLGVDGRARRGRRPARPGRPSWALRGTPADRQRLPRRVGHRRVPARRRRRRRHRPGHRRVAGRRPGRRPLRLGARRLDALAGAAVAGHVLECGAQATGGNYAFFTELADLGRARLPDRRDPTRTARRVITKHPAPAARSPSTRSPRSCSTRSAAPGTPAPT